VEDTPARRLIEAVEEGRNGVLLNKNTGPQPLNCEVGKFRLSGHSNRQDLLRLVEHLSPQQVVLVHGEPDSRAWMADHIQRSHPDITVHQPEWGTPLDL